MNKSDVERIVAFVTTPRCLALLGRFAGWLVVRGVGSGSRSPWIGETWLVARGIMHGLNVRAYLVIYEFHDLALVLHLLRPGDLFVDVGANIGAYTIAASGVCGAQTLAFEPDPISCASLVTCVQANGLEQLVTVREAALGACSGMAHFTIGLDTQNRVLSAPAENSRLVPMAVLDEALSGAEPTIIKLDVEGFEEAVLQGAENALASPKLQVVISENRSPKIVETLARHGFCQFSYDPRSRSLFRVASSINMNAIFVRDPEWASRRIRETPVVSFCGTRV